MEGQRTKGETLPSFSELAEEKRFEAERGSQLSPDLLHLAPGFEGAAQQPSGPGRSEKENEKCGDESDFERAESEHGGILSHLPATGNRQQGR